MKNLIYLILLFFIIAPVFGNSMSYDGQGDQIIPLENNPIELKKEILNLVWNTKDKKFDIDVEFTFFNPQEDIDLNLGFFNPVSRFSTNRKERVYDFSIMSDGEKLEYTLLDRDEISNQYIRNLYDGPFVVYQFLVHFKKGYTKINHHYSFGGNTDLIETRYISYILKTALNWSNSRIEDFQLFIKVPPKTIITFVNDLVDINKWQFKEPTKSAIHKEPNLKYIYTVSGEARFLAHNFIPKNNLQFQFNPDLNYSVYMNKWYFIDKRKDDYWYSDFFFVDGMYMSLLTLDLSKYTTDQLVLLQNTLLAMEGYKFEDPRVFQFFDQFIWYIPNESIKPSIAQLSKDRKAFYLKCRNEINSRDKQDNRE